LRLLLPIIDAVTAKYYGAWLNKDKKEEELLLLRAALVKIEEHFTKNVDQGKFAFNTEHPTLLDIYIYPHLVRT
jgi:hypothetical protein